jgi:hypothetical protein
VGEGGVIVSTTIVAEGLKLRDPVKSDVAHEHEGIPRKAEMSSPLLHKKKVKFFSAIDVYTCYRSTKQ